MDQFGYTFIYLSDIFNNTIMYLNKGYMQILKWDDKRLIFEKLLKYSIAIYSLDRGYYFGNFIDSILNTIYQLIVD